VHLENRPALARLGLAVQPPVPAFCRPPQTVEAVVDHVARELDPFGTAATSAQRWDGRMHPAPPVRAEK